MFSSFIEECSHCAGDGTEPMSGKWRDSHVCSVCRGDGEVEGARQMNQWVALDYADGLAVIGPFSTCDDVWRWVETLPAWRQALVRPAQMERPTHTTGAAP